MNLTEKQQLFFNIIKIVAHYTTNKYLRITEILLTSFLQVVIFYPVFIDKYNMSWKWRNKK